MQVLIVVRVHACKSEFVWNVHIQVMLNVVSFSVLNMHGFVEIWLLECVAPLCAPVLSCAHFFQAPYAGCMVAIAIVFEIPRLTVKCPVSLTRWRFQTPISAILSAHLWHLLHEFIMNVKCRMDWCYRKPYICLSFNFFKQNFSNGI